MKKLFDLRFVIGIFFLAIGLLLLIHSLIATTTVGFNANVNLYSSLAFIVFAVIMLILSRGKRPKDIL
ncbi:MAG: hypothetical protein JSS98_14155 [Bacteroidetes bacterium]|nr:hypothetical protein [Bacteroidota bacterium]